MKFKKTIITSATLLGLINIGAVSQLISPANADATPAEKAESTRVDNALTEKYGNHVPASASLNAERSLNREFSGSASGNQQQTSQENNQQVNNSQPKYTGKTLPQTGEASINPLALAAVLSMTGIGLAVLNLLYKRNYANATTDDLSMNIKSKCDNLFKSILTNNIK